MDAVKRPAAIALLLLLPLALGAASLVLSMRMSANVRCCQTSFARNVSIGARELLGLDTYYGQAEQDKWVLETVFPGVRDGFFLDVGSGDGTVLSNTKSLEARGWTGVCVDPFPTNMDDRTCLVLKEVVFDETGRTLSFTAADVLGGITDTLNSHRDAPAVAAGRTVQVVTTTLADLLARIGAPAFIHYMSLDIEGAELEALRGFPFDRHRLGALTVEHNFEEPKRGAIEALLRSHGYVRVHAHHVDDYYRPAGR